MAGLLGDGWDDPKSLATLQLAAGLLGPGSLGQGLSRGLMGYQGAMSNAADLRVKQQGIESAQQEGKLREIQMQQALAQIEAQQRQRAFLQNLPSPQQQANTTAFNATGAPLGTVAAANAMPAVPAGNQQLLEAVRAGVVSYPDYLAATRKDTAPVKLEAGAKLLAPGTFKELAANPKEIAPDPLTALIARRDALPEGDPRRRLYDAAINKATTHSPGTSVNINTEKPLLNSVASGLGKQIDDSLAAARAATSAITTAQTLRAAIDSGKVVSGPGATFRIAGLQIGQLLGVGGKDAAEVLANTRIAIQSMAQAELAAAQQMKGQGQITEAERDIIRRAAAGNVNEMTGPELRLLSGTMEKTARAKIKQHEANVSALGRMPNAAPLLPFYQVEEPPAYAAPSSAPAAVRRYNPKTGRIE